MTTEISIALETKIHELFHIFQPDTKGQILYDSTYMKYVEWQIHKDSK